MLAHTQLLQCASHDSLPACMTPHHHDIGGCYDLVEDASGARMVSFANSLGQAPGWEDGGIMQFAGHDSFGLLCCRPQTLLTFREERTNSSVGLSPAMLVERMVNTLQCYTPRQSQSPSLASGCSKAAQQAPHHTGGVFHCAGIDTSLHQFRTCPPFYYTICS